MPTSRGRKRAAARPARIVLLCAGTVPSARCAMLLGLDDAHVVRARVEGIASLDGVDKLIVSTRGQRNRGRWMTWTVERLDDERPPLFAVTEMASNRPN